MTSMSSLDPAVTCASAVLTRYCVDLLVIELVRSAGPHLEDSSCSKSEKAQDGEIEKTSRKYKVKRLVQGSTYSNERLSGGRLSRCAVKQVASLLRYEANHVQQRDEAYLPTHSALANSGNRFLKCFKTPLPTLGRIHAKLPTRFSFPRGLLYLCAGTCCICDCNGFATTLTGKPPHVG
jgi:hypothetical protein